MFRKPKSIVKYNIFPSLVTAAALYLAAPLCNIYNTMTTTGQWPSKRKEEFVTSIPEKAVPEGLDDLCNISCTALFSKVYESFVLEWMCGQIGMRENQMGGMKGAGTEHYLVLLWQQVLKNLEDSRAASLLMSIDYSKAFNRLDFGHCLRALARKGASTEVIGIVASFLTSRMMAVKVGQAFSSPRIVLGGVPQGSILGVFLFNATTDSFEAGSKDVDRYMVIGGRQDRQPDLDLDEYDRSLDNKPAPAYNRPGFRAWHHKPLVVLKYVDDNIILEKVFFDGSVIDENGQKVLRALWSENLFNRITFIAESNGMRMNDSKTVLLCISDAQTFEPVAYIVDRSGNRILPKERMKFLGVNFSSRPDASAYVDSVCRKFRSRVWVLRVLHHAGFSQDDLLKVYKSTILPCHDYCSNVFHSSLTLLQTITLERLQAKALKAMFGYNPSYRELMERAKLPTLRARRESRGLKFAMKCASSERFSAWFPTQPATSTRLGEVYREEFARSVRCYNSPLYSMRRRLNREARNNNVDGGAREGRVV